VIDMAYFMQDYPLNFIIVQTGKKCRRHQNIPVPADKTHNTGSDHTAAEQVPNQDIPVFEITHLAGFFNALAVKPWCHGTTPP